MYWMHIGKVVLCSCRCVVVVFTCQMSTAIEQIQVVALACVGTVHMFCGSSNNLELIGWKWNRIATQTLFESSDCNEGCLVFEEKFLIISSKIIVRTVFFFFFAKLFVKFWRDTQNFLRIFSLSARNNVKILFPPNFRRSSHARMC